MCEAASEVYWHFQRLILVVKQNRQASTLRQASSHPEAFPRLAK